MSTYYVAKFGSLTGNGGPATPFLKIAQSNSVVKPGDTVQVETGTYNETVTPITSGTPGNPITYQNYNGNSVTIDGGGIIPGYGGLFDLSGLSYITLSGLTIENSGYAGIFDIGVSDHITLQNLIIHDTVESAILIGSYYGGTRPNSPTITNLLIDGCITYNTNSGIDQEGISLIDVNGFEIENCSMSTTFYNGAPCLDCKQGCQNGLIHSNIVHDQNYPGGIYIDCAGNPTSNIKVYGNIIYNIPGAAIQLADEHGVSTMSGVLIYNNVIFDCGVALEVDDYAPFTATISFTFINNTCDHNYTSDGTEIIIVPSHKELSACVIRNNILSTGSGFNGIIYSDYANGGVTIDHNLFYFAGGLAGASNIPGTNYIIGNPIFNNPTTDFSLQTGSPAIGSASAVGAPSTDFNGNPWTGCIGAYQYQTAGGFTHGTPHTASFQITENPYGKSCQFEFWLGPNQTTKIATAGKVNFTSGASVPVSCSITMPAAGTYNVYVDVYMLGVLIDKLVASSTVTVI